ncbi:hypothetical protein HOP50_06g44510 [Chloropicon primus]|uniref:Uncharacterized protein n=1 Tax=Chloropicon primus TaxID=1764295 RepID=A0A5B8MN61_9CHLO|nr:hypothetical protein A3770_06p44270 [Chloropicon primus]UPR01130.1 hypothetical protein HOP50_06g44510 [Chloropicon primus]|eukprot:QDZ21909.1 hypothetical protein A3770_06p44270 [Chloropicon primus]
MKIVACNWRHWQDTLKEDYMCRYITEPQTMPEGMTYKRMFVFSDWFTVLFGPKETVSHAQWMRVGYSVVAILIALVCLILSARSTELQIGLTLGALAFPVYSLVALKFCEAFPAPSFTTLYLVLSAASTLASLTGWACYYFDKPRVLTKGLYVFLGAPMFVLLLSGLDGHWPYLGMEIGDPPTYNLPYFVCGVVAITSTLLVTLFPKRLVRDFVFHFSTANYFAFAVLTGLFPTIDKVEGKKTEDSTNNTALSYGIACVVVVLATSVKLFLNKDAAMRDEDNDSEIEMADPEMGDKNSNPLLRDSSGTLTSNPLWSLSEKKEDEEDQAED